MIWKFYDSSLSPWQNFLDKNKNGGMHHICIEVNDIQAAMKDLTAQNIRCLSKEPKIGAHGKPVVFLHPKDCAGVLVELEEVWGGLVGYWFFFSHPYIFIINKLEVWKYVVMK